MQKTSMGEQLAWLLGGAIVVVGFMVWLGSRTPDTPQGQRDMSAVESMDHSWGPENAAVTIVEYSDLQCPACANYHPAFKQLRVTHADKIRFVYRHHPLYEIHPLADLASRATEAAHKQGKFWEMQDRIFTTQASWTALSVEQATDRFAAFAKELGMDEGRFRKDIVADDVAARVTRDMAMSNRAGVSGTPTFFINGSVASLPSNYASLRSLIDGLLTTTSSSTPTK